MKQEDFNRMEVEGFLPFLAALRAVKQPVSTTPTRTPRSLIEQFVIYQNGTTRRLYVYVGNAWRYVALT